MFTAGQSRILNMDAVDQMRAEIEDEMQVGDHLVQYKHSSTCWHMRR